MIFNDYINFLVSRILEKNDIVSFETFTSDEFENIGHLDKSYILNSLYNKSNIEEIANSLQEHGLVLVTMSTTNKDIKNEYILYTIGDAYYLTDYTMYINDSKSPFDITYQMYSVRDFESILDSLQ